jgi:hypothetical protein
VTAETAAGPAGRVTERPAARPCAQVAAGAAARTRARVTPRTGPRSRRVHEDSIEPARPESVIQTVGSPCPLPRPGLGGIIPARKPADRACGSTRCNRPYAPDVRFTRAGLALRAQAVPGMRQNK